jgi:hypothetical protein
MLLFLFHLKWFVSILPFRKKSFHSGLHEFVFYPVLYPSLLLFVPATVTLLKHVLYHALTVAFKLKRPQMQPLHDQGIF